MTVLYRCSNTLGRTTLARRRNSEPRRVSVPETSSTSMASSHSCQGDYSPQTADNVSSVAKVDGVDHAALVGCSSGDHLTDANCLVEPFQCGFRPPGAEACLRKWPCVQGTPDPATEALALCLDDSICNRVEQGRGRGAAGGVPPGERQLTGALSGSQTNERPLGFRLEVFRAFGL